MRLLILDADWPQTAYLVAEFAALGADVALASPRQPDPKGLGRYCEQYRSPPPISADYASFALKLINEVPADLILPTCEVIQQLLWSAPRSIADRVFPRATPLQQTLLADRTRMYAFAEATGVPVPPMQVIKSASSLDDAVRRLGLPCVIRGLQGFAGAQVRIAMSRAQALAAMNDVATLSGDTVFAQPFIEGERCLVGGLFEDGRPCQLFAQRTLRASSPPTGPSILVESVIDPRLTAYAETLFRSLGWNGLACAEFIRSLDDEVYFLEINPRPWAAIVAAHQCGVPMLRRFAERMMGHTQKPRLRYRVGKKCALFPAYVIDLVARGGLDGPADAIHFLSALSSAPWRKPPLMREFLKSVRWAYGSKRAT